MTETSKQDETTRLRQLIMGFRVTQLIYVAAKLGIADHLAQGPRTTDDLASVVGADAGALYRLLRALASLGVFAQTADGRFEMTTTAELLRRDRPGSLRSTALLYGDELLWRAYGRLSLAIETGHSAFEQVYGEPFYDYLSQHPNSASLFHEAMTGFSELEAAAIMAAYDLASISAVVDVGGGQGALMAAFLRAHPHLRAIILDRSAPTDETQKLFAGSNIAGRSRFMQGDFFASIPDGGDLYVLKSILHNWNDAAAGTILRKCCDAMPMHARLLVAERVVPLGNAPSEAKLFDINMLVTVGGRERAEADYAALFRSAGLQLTRTIPTNSQLSLVEGLD